MMDLFVCVVLGHGRNSSLDCVLVVVVDLLLHLGQLLLRMLKFYLVRHWLYRLVVSYFDNIFQCQQLSDQKDDCVAWQVQKLHNLLFKGIALQVPATRLRHLHVVSFLDFFQTWHKSVKAKFFTTSYSSDDCHFYWGCLHIKSMKICSVYLVYIVRNDLHFIFEIEQR